MSQYANLKAAIAANVYENHNNQVTANMVKAAMNAMTDSLGAGYQYLGIATPDTAPGTPDQRVFYIAAQPGTYTNFSGLVVNDGEVAFLKYDTAWHKEVTGAATAAQVTELGQKVYDYGFEDEAKANALLGWDSANEMPGCIAATTFGFPGSHKVFSIKQGDILSFLAGANPIYYLILKDYKRVTETTSFSSLLATGESARHVVTAGENTSYTISSADAKYVVIENTRESSGTPVDSKPIGFAINGKDVSGLYSNALSPLSNNLIKNSLMFEMNQRTSDGERPLKYGVFQPWNSSFITGSSTVVLLTNVRLVNGQKYTAVVNGDGVTTAPSNFTLKVMEADSVSMVYAIKAYGNSTIPSNDIVEFVWTGTTKDNYRIGLYTGFYGARVDVIFYCSTTYHDLIPLLKSCFYMTQFEQGVAMWVSPGPVISKEAEKDWVISQKIPVSNGDVVTWKSGYPSASYNYALVIYDNEGNYVNYYSRGANPSRTFTISEEDAAYMIASFYLPAKDGWLDINGERVLTIDDFAIYLESNFVPPFKSKESALSSVVSKSGTTDIKTSDKFSLLWFSDLHGNTDNLSDIVEFNSRYADLLDDVIHTGDSVKNTINSADPFQQVAGAEKILNVIGNHEAWLSSSDPDYYATEKQTYDKIFAPSIANWGVTQPADAATNGYCYYYKDYATAKFRLIVLDSVHWHYRNGASQTNAAQKSWFESILADAITNNLRVVCAMHYTPQNGIVPLANTGFNVLGTTAGAAIADGWYAVDEIFGCVDTFIGNGGKFAGWIMGHTHNDYIGKVYGHTSQPVVVIGTAGATSVNNRFIFSLESQNNFNVITFENYGGKDIIKMVKFGQDTDIYMRSKKSIAYNCTDDTIIATN